MPPLDKPPLPTFEENPDPNQVALDPLNQCLRCGRRAGRYLAPDRDKGGFIGVYLINDSRGFKICNLCASEGVLIKKQKLGKSEKKKFKVFKRSMKQVKNIPHITLDAKGNKVE